MNTLLGIYIHIPFCASKCRYCDFNSHISSESEREAYIDALCREISAFSECDGRVVDTIYFGGGTPTVLKPKQLIRILDTVRANFTLTSDCEITFECNPATIDKDGLSALKSVGFNRISIGMQSADNEQLKILGRIHSFEDCESCVLDTVAAGFENISLDLMFGLPNQDIKSWIFSLNAAVNLNPSHLSCYALKIEQGTPFSKMKLNIADDDESGDMYDKCVELLKNHGYGRYEISNFAKDGFKSRHNCKYWQCDSFVGFGAGAYSCIGNKRFSNIRDTSRYIKLMTDCGSASADVLPLTPSDMMSEFVFLGLRMDCGISEAEFYSRFGVSIYSAFKSALDTNISRGTLTRKNGRINIPPRYTYVSNSIMSDFVL